MKLTLNIVAAISGLLAAFLWLKSTLVKVPYQETKDVHGWTEAAIISNGADVLETAREQTRWSKWAACAASVSALCQSVSLVLPDE
jgi:hypothetical protein